MHSKSKGHSLPFLGEPQPLCALPSQTYLAEAKELEKSPVQRGDIDQAREELRKLVKATTAALEHHNK